MDPSQPSAGAHSRLPDAWAEHFERVSEIAAPEFDAQHLARISRRVGRLRRAMASANGRHDGPFSEVELTIALASLPLHRAPGIDGLPYEALKVDDPLWRKALLALLNLVLAARLCPSAWKFAVVCPVFQIRSAGVVR